uniref:Uncharacterized protein n=1 Tax=Anguilla anguilla TaxID=7936 RepID=A0A0E9PTK1_ANGAN
MQLAQTINPIHQRRRYYSMRQEKSDD